MKILSIIFFSLFHWSCSPYKTIPKEIKQKFINRFDDKRTNIQNLIDIKGYYQSFDKEKIYSGYGENRKEYDSIPINLVFWDDGTLAYNFSFEINSTEQEISENFRKNIKSGKFGFANYDGIYRIKGDTIVVQYINHPGKLVPWDYRELMLKIVDRKTIKFLDDDPNFTPFYFKKADSIPPPVCWLKEEKWLWKDENEWVKYMESRKRKKRK